MPRRALYLIVLVLVMALKLLFPPDPFTKMQVLEYLGAEPERVAAFGRSLAGR